MQPRLISALAAVALSIACAKEAPPPPPPPPPPPAKTPEPPPPPLDTATQAAPAMDEATAAAEAAEVFKTRCSTCHGLTGNADGPAAAALNPKPRKFSDAEWQKSVTDDHLEKIIREGGAAVGKSPLMPPNPDLKDKGAVVTALRKIVRGGGKM